MMEDKNYELFEQSFILSKKVPMLYQASKLLSNDFVCVRVLLVLCCLVRSSLVHVRSVSETRGRNQCGL